MKLPFLLFALVFAGCSSLPTPRQSEIVRVSLAGQTWMKSRMATAVYAADITAKDRLPFFVEISLPNPDGSAPEVIRKEIKKGETTIQAEGQPRSRWVAGATYEYGLKIFSDGNYSQLLDSVVQPSKCVRPPGSLLDQLKEPIQSTTDNSGASPLRV